MLLACAAILGQARADNITVCDFEQNEIGQAFNMKDIYNTTTTSTAVVEADPANEGNKVLHVKNTSWNTFIEFELPDGVTMWFCDIRTFGTLYLVTNNDAYIEGYETLGPEPLSEGFTAGYMRPVIAKSRKPIKTLILEQTFIAGLGNIYADECLALSGILPMRTANTLTDEEIDRLHDAINKVIAQGIANRGTTFRDDKDGEGNRGDNQNHLLVYGRKGLCCKMCGGELLGTKVGGRGTTYCPHCQK